MTTIALRFAPARSRAGARVAFQIACAIAGSLLVAGLAQVVVYLPFTPVPITGQTLGVLLVGAAFGPALGAATLGLYLVWGVVGLPFFAPQADGTHQTGAEVLRLSSATGGYLWGFVVAAGLVGWLARRGWDRTFRSSVSAMFFGEIAIMTLGLVWLMFALDVGIQEALVLGFYPYVIGDVAKLLLAAALLPAAWALMDRYRPEG